MADTTYTDGVTVIAADSMNDFNRLHYTIFGDPATLAALMQTIESAYIYLRDEKAAASAGGTLTAGSWAKRTLNTEVNDSGNYASLSSSVIALLAGTYRFKASAPGYAVDGHKIRLANTSDTVYYYGSSEYSSNVTPAAQSRSFVAGRFTISGTKNFELQHYSQTTQATTGMGTGNGTGAGVIEVYAEVEFWRLY